MDVAIREIVKGFKALADSTRYRIISMLVKRGELGCGDLASEFPITQSAMSHHYRVLENAGLVTTRKKGSHVFLCLNRERLEHLAAALEPAARAKTSKKVKSTKRR